MSEAGAPAPGESDPAALPRAVVAGHGDLAAGLVSAVAQITGRGQGLVPLTNRGLGGDVLEQTLREALTASGAHVVFTDLPGGSWTIAAHRVRRSDPAVVVVAGVSLPVLLAWVTGVADGEVAARAEAAAEKGRRALLVASGASAPGVAGGR